MVGAQMSKIIAEDMASLRRPKENEKFVFERLEVFYLFQSV